MELTLQNAVSGNVLAEGHALSPPGPLQDIAGEVSMTREALERDLDDILASSPTTFRHVQPELPIFGPPSELAARASVAAGRQGLQQPQRRCFMRTTLVAGERSVLGVAATVGLDTEQPGRNMRAPKVQAELDRTRALADVFGFIGTPGLVIGRKVIVGAVPASLLQRIIAAGQSMAQLRC